MYYRFDTERIGRNAELVTEAYKRGDFLLLFAVVRICENSSRTIGMEEAKELMDAYREALGRVSAAIEAMQTRTLTRMITVEMPDA